MRTVPAAAVGLAALLVAVRLAAHHGCGNCDAGRTLERTGTVREVSYDNPHGTMGLENPGKTGFAILAPEMTAVGKPVTVVGHPHRTDAEELRVEPVVAGGTSVEPSRTPGCGDLARRLDGGRRLRPLRRPRPSAAVARWRRPGRQC